MVQIMAPPSPSLSKYINITKGKLYSFTQFKLDVVVNQLIYAKNAVEWIDMMVVRLSDGMYEIPAIINTDAMRKAIGRVDLDNNWQLITNKRVTIKRSCLNICRKEKSITPYIFVLDFTLGDNAGMQQGQADICFHEDVRKWIGTLQRNEFALCSSSYDTADLEIRVKNLKSQESMLEWILATSPEELEEEDEQEEEKQALEVYTPLVPLKYDTFEDYQNDIDRVWDSMGHLPDSFCFPVHHCEEENEVNGSAMVVSHIDDDDDDQELEDETVASVTSGVDGQCIQEQLSIATVPTERNRLLRKLRVCYFSNNITCSLAEA